LPALFSRTVFTCCLLRSTAASFCCLSVFRVPPTEAFTKWQNCSIGHIYQRRRQSTSSDCLNRSFGTPGRWDHSCHTLCRRVSEGIARRSLLDCLFHAYRILGLVIFVIEYLAGQCEVLEHMGWIYPSYYFLLSQLTDIWDIRRLPKDSFSEISLLFTCTTRYLAFL